MSIDYLNSKSHLAEKIFGWDRKTATLTRVTLEWAKTMTWKGVCPVLKLLETTYQSRYDLQYPPSILGGSKSEALKNYLKAKKLMESKAQELSDDWNYLSLLVSIAKTYELLNDNRNAKLVYEEILRSEPQFKWVRDELYPRLIKKLN